MRAFAGYAAATEWCPEPGCDRKLEVDLDSPNVLRCSMHGPMLLREEQ